VVRTLLANGAASTVTDFTVNQAANGIAPGTATITGLTNGVAVEFVVQACNASGCSPFSVSSAVVTPQALTVPGPPTGLVATGGCNASAQMAWTAPASNGSSPIVSYTVTSTPGGLTTTVPATTIYNDGRAL
jgi:large repetitive protein